MKKIKSTKAQRDAILKCHPGVGFLVYKVNESTTCEFEFCTTKKGVMSYISNGRPIEITFTEEAN